jgi:hypothetical protein
MPQLSHTARDSWRMADGAGNRGKHFPALQMPKEEVPRVTPYATVVSKLTIYGGTVAQWHLSGIQDPCANWVIDQ